MDDDLNPDFIFSCTFNELLIKIAKGTIDVVRLAKDELQFRGLDIDGKWVGFHEKIK